MVKLRGLVLAAMKLALVGYFVFYLFYVYNVTAYGKYIAAESNVWNMLPGIFITFSVIVVATKILVLKDDVEKKTLIDEVKMLSELFYDIAYWAPLLLFAIIAIRTDQIIYLYVGLGLGGLAFAATKFYDYRKYADQTDGKNANE